MKIYFVLCLWPHDRPVVLLLGHKYLHPMTHCHLWDFVVIDATSLVFCASCVVLWAETSMVQWSDSKMLQLYRLPSEIVFLHPLPATNVLSHTVHWHGSTLQCIQIVMHIHKSAGAFTEYFMGVFLIRRMWNVSDADKICHTSLAVVINRSLTSAPASTTNL